jgi:hypothetical protein
VLAEQAMMARLGLHREPSLKFRAAMPTAPSKRVFYLPATPLLDVMIQNAFNAWMLSTAQTRLSNMQTQEREAQEAKERAIAIALKRAKDLKDQEIFESDEEEVMEKLLHPPVPHGDMIQALLN